MTTTATFIDHQVMEHVDLDDDRGLAASHAIERVWGTNSAPGPQADGRSGSLRYRHLCDHQASASGD